MAFEIPVELDDTPIMRVFQRIKAQAQETGDVLRQSMTVGPSSVGSVGRTGIGAGGPGPAGASMRSYGYHIGNRQRLEEANNWLDKAKASGDNAIIGDAQARVARLQRAVDRDDRLLNGPTQNQAFMDMIMSSRVLPGGQLSPLVGRLMAFKNAAGGGAGQADDYLQSLGVGAEDAAKYAPFVARVAALALPAAVATGGVAIAAAFTTMGMRIAEQRNDVARRFPGPSESIGRAVALGLDPGGIAERLRGGSLGAAYMRSRGIVDVGWRTRDRAGNAVRVMDEMRKIPDPNLRAEVAENLGISDKLYMGDVSDTTYNRVKESVKNAGTPENRRRQAEYKAEMDIATNTIGNGLQTLGGIGAGAFNDIMSGDWRRALRGLMGGKLGSDSEANSAQDGAGAVDGASAGASFGGGTSARQIAQNTADTVRAIKEMTEIIGGGSRARGAIPEGFGAYLKLDRDLDNHARVLGAFSVA